MLRFVFIPFECDAQRGGDTLSFVSRVFKRCALTFFWSSGVLCFHSRRQEQFVQGLAACVTRLDSSQFVVARVLLQE